MDIKIDTLIIRMYNRNHEKNNTDFICFINYGCWMRGEIIVATPESRLSTILSCVLKIPPFGGILIIRQLVLRRAPLALWLAYACCV